MNAYVQQLISRVQSVRSHVFQLDLYGPSPELRVRISAAAIDQHVPVQVKPLSSGVLEKYTMQVS
jgi:hypothetical protein